MNNKIILVTANQLGQGDLGLGEILLENYFTILKQQDSLPKAIFFLNEGVKALTSESLASLHIKELEDQGVEVLACKTCVEHFGIQDSLSAGQISTMARFIELSGKHEVISL